MQKHHGIITGIVVIGGGFIIYRMFNLKHKVGAGDPILANGMFQTDRSVLSGYHKGYSNMMNLSPEYYNAGSLEGGAFNVQDYESSSEDDFFYTGKNGTTPWTMGFNGGKGDMVSPGWTAESDSYSDRVSQAWLQQAVAGSHL